MSANFVALTYLFAAVLFILTLKGLSSPATSRRGNQFGMIGMAIAVLTTLTLTHNMAYILIAIQLEEHDMVAVFGDTYRGYQKRVSMILPWIPGPKA